MFFLRLYLFITMILKLNSSPIQTIKKSVNNNSDKTGNDVEYTERIERIKRNILQKLELDHVPTESFPRENIPKPLLDDILHEHKSLVHNDDNEENVLRKTITVLGKLVHREPCRKHRCVRVSFTEKAYNTKIKSVQIWLNIEHTTRHANIQIYKINEDNSRERVSFIHYPNISSNWQALNIKKHKILKHDLFDETYINTTLEIHCKHCKISIKTIEKPFLTLFTISKLQHRRRRSTTDDCTNNSCCRSSLVIDFKAIGWDNWVLSPLSYDAHYCHGNCYKNDDTSYQYHHTSILKAISKKRLKKEVNVCCTTRKYSPLTMIYVNDGMLIKRVVENMIVDQCVCT